MRIGVTFDRTMYRVTAASVVLASMLAGGSLRAQAAPLKAAVFDLELVDGGEAGMPRVAPERLKKANDVLRQVLKASGQMELLDLTPQAEAIAKSSPLRTCNGCDLDIAAKLGADIEVTTAVQRSSTQITGFSGSIRDVKTGKVLRSGLVDVRGDSDDLWAHGVKFLVKERLLDPPLPKTEQDLRALADK